MLGQWFDAYVRCVGWFMDGIGGDAWGWAVANPVIASAAIMGFSIGSVVYAGVGGSRLIERNWD